MLLMFYWCCHVDVEVTIRIMALYHVSLSDVVDLVIVFFHSLNEYPAYVVVTVLSLFIFIVTLLLSLIPNTMPFSLLWCCVLFQVSCYLYVFLIAVGWIFELLLFVAVCSCCYCYI